MASLWEYTLSSTARAQYRVLTGAQRAVVEDAITYVCRDPRAAYCYPLGDSWSYGNRDTGVNLIYCLDLRYVLITFLKIRAIR